MLCAHHSRWCTCTTTLVRGVKVWKRAHTQNPGSSQQLGQENSVLPYLR